MLKIASELQIRLRRRVDLNEAIRFLISEKEKKPHLLEEVCKPIPEVERALKELYAERELNEKRLKLKIGVRHRYAD
jgi:hypothetical protein